MLTAQFNVLETHLIFFRLAFRARCILLNFAGCVYVLRLGLPSTLISPKIGAFRKRPSNRCPHVISLPEFFSITNPKRTVMVADFKFMGCTNECVRRTFDAFSERNFRF